MATQTFGHSAKVAITLVCDGRRIPVAQVGNTGILVRDLEAEVPAGMADLVVEIDGRKQSKTIMLPEGITQAGRFAKFF